MEIELRGKKWMQISPEVYATLNRKDHVAMFIDEFYAEKTYFMEICDVVSGGSE